MSAIEGGRHLRRGIVTQVVLYLLLGAAALVFAIPLFWLFTSALKSNADIYKWPPLWLPVPPNFQNFADAWRAAPFGQFLVNSLITAIVGAAAKVVLACTCAYAFAFLKFPGKNKLFLVLLTAIMVPGNVTFVVNYLTVGYLGWINTYAGLIVPGIGSVFGTFLLKQHMESLPREIMESAEMDGAGHLRRLIYIVLPLSRPILVTVALIALIDDWNSFIWPLIVTNSASMRTLPIGLYFLNQTDGVNNWGVVMAGTVVVLLPMLIIFLLAQRLIVGGLTHGAVKG